jgi:hypothetical protein
MNSTRGAIACALVALVLLGPLSPWALAQQPASPPAEPPPAVVIEVIPPEPEPPLERRRDIYDVGAGVVTVAKAPFNVALCALGSAIGTVLFLGTLGSAYKASTRVFEEGCAQRWIVSGEDLRPRGAPGIFPDHMTDAYRRR